MNLNEIYTQLILEQSRNQRNRRELENYTHKELGHNPSCGDEITLMLRIKDQTIEDASYIGQGCAISQASTSIMIDEIKKIKVEKALEMCKKFIAMVKGQIKDEDELEELGDAIAFESIQNLPARVKCAVLPWYTLMNIIEEGKTQGSFKSE